jgi:hypothetical protein
MKIIISESQYNRIISEQPDSKMPYQIEKFGYNPSSKNPNQSFGGALKRQSEFFQTMDLNSNLGLLSIATAFVPVVGPFLSLGISLADAAVYAKKGETNNAAFILALSALPYIGPVVKKIPGISNLGPKGMTLLASKISKGLGLTKTETQIAKSLSQNSKLIQSQKNNILNVLKNKKIIKTKTPVTKRPLTKSSVNPSSLIRTQKSNLFKKGVKLLRPGDLPKHFYHGSWSKINLSELTPSWAGKRNVMHSSGSTGRDGMYFSENLWDGMSLHNKFKNPVYSKGPKTVGAANAEVWAQDAIKNGKTGYIYEMKLSPDAIVVPEGVIPGVGRVNVAGINSEYMKKLLDMGIDAIYRSEQELVILNKRAIKSFDLKYIGDKFIGKNIKNKVGNTVPVEGSFGFNWKALF